MSHLKMNGNYPVWLMLSWIACTDMVMGAPPATPLQDDSLKASLYFHAPFDGTTDAKVARHDEKLYTAPTLKRMSADAGMLRDDVELLAEGGRHGGALRFKDKSAKVLFYAGKNMDYRTRDWEGTVSLWLRLTPDEDLKPGYSDPLQITEKAWNDASFFIDYDIDTPRTFRLGVFADYKFWNPEDTKWEAIPAEDRPMVAVGQPPFSRERWTHVAWTFSGINSSTDQAAVCRLYLDGKLQGEMKRPLQFQWDLEKTAIMLGLDFVGDIDELMIFDRALTEAEIQRLQSFFNED